ncbi:hypothetical protein SUGI_0339470 [Cryptomeria japonica]|nr:hypothetical protein SUGI_0339470 [Cryptomeria japonica]
MEAHLQLFEIFLTVAKPMALQEVFLLNITDIIGSENHLSMEEIASHISSSTNKLVHIDCLSRITRLPLEASINKPARIDYLSKQTSPSDAKPARIDYLHRK